MDFPGSVVSVFFDNDDGIDEIETQLLQQMELVFLSPFLESFSPNLISLCRCSHVVMSLSNFKC